MFICSPGITQNAANLCKDLITVNLGAICQSWHKDPCKKVDPGRGGGCTERRLVTFSNPIHKVVIAQILQPIFSEYDFVK